MKKRFKCKRKKPRLALTVGLTCLLLLTASLYACGSGAASRSASDSYQAASDLASVENESAGEASSGAEAASASGSSSGAPATDPDQAKRIVTQNLDLETTQVSQALDGLAAAASQLQGYVSSRSLYESDGSYYGSITVRIPAGEENGFANAAAQLGSIRRQDSSIEDISDTYYDAQARLTNAKAQETRLLEMYAQAENVEDMVAIQLQLDSVQERIEVLEGSLRLWDNQVAYSTVNVSIYTDSDLISTGSDVPRFVDRSKVWARLKSGLQTSAVQLVNQGANLLIWLAGHLLQLLLLLVVLSLVILLLRRHRKAHRSGRRSSPTTALSQPERPASQTDHRKPEAETVGPDPDSLGGGAADVTPPASAAEAKEDKP
ncbi:MAG: DUF4349 domain-containing protein [Oscillospiraceae bacterium]|nr:DUF4349 domain-containing protein [Oscillospiraceae bacterium]MDD4369211.1 DUF4349 domain-containing protein [Oscillospiraceae bacterium]